MTAEKDNEQDSRLNHMEIDIAGIKSVTHGSKVMDWAGIIPEHKKLSKTVGQLKENSDYVAKFFRGVITAIKVVSIIATLIISIYTIFHLIN